MSQVTEFENEFTQLLQQKKLDEAKDLILSAKAVKNESGGKDYPDFEGMTRMGRSRAIVLLEGKSTKVIQEAIYPRFLKMSTDGLMTDLVKHVESIKANGTPADLNKHPKAAPGPVGGGDNEEDGEEKEEEKEEPKNEEEKPAKKKKAKKKRKVSASRKTEEPAGDEKEAPKEEERKSDIEPSLKDLGYPDVDSDMGKLLKYIDDLGLDEIEDKVDDVHADMEDLGAKFDELGGELVVNLKGMIGALQQNKDQEQRLKDAVSEVQELRKAVGVLHEQQGFMVAAVNFLGGNLTDLSPNEFHAAVRVYYESLLDEAEEKTWQKKDSKD